MVLIEYQPIESLLVIFKYIDFSSNFQLKSGDCINLTAQLEVIYKIYIEWKICNSIQLIEILDIMKAKGADFNMEDNEGNSVIKLLRNEEMKKYDGIEEWLSKNNYFNNPNKSAAKIN